MQDMQIYILISVLALVAIVVIFFLTRKDKHKPLSKLAVVAFFFLIVGIIFGENRLIGYSLTGLGVFLAIIDIFLKIKNRDWQKN